VKTERVPQSLVLGIDPGAKFCGLALVWGRDLVAWDLLERDGQSVKDWVEECRAAVHLMVYPLGRSYRIGDALGDLAVAVEAVEPPKTFIDGERRYRSKSEPLLDTAAVMGGMVVWAATEGFPCVLVAPAGNGSGRREGYPAELWGAREGPAGTGKLGHVRSAYDCALAGRTMLAQALLSAPPGQR
jgi:hypothetical protein